MTGQNVIVPLAGTGYELLPLPNLYALNDSSQDYEALPIPNLIAMGATSSFSAFSEAHFSLGASSSVSSGNLGDLPIPPYGASSSSAGSALNSSVSSSLSSGATSGASSATVIAGTNNGGSGGAGGGGGGGGGRRDAGRFIAVTNTGRQPVAAQARQTSDGTPGTAPNSAANPSPESAVAGD